MIKILLIIICSGSMSGLKSDKNTLASSFQDSTGRLASSSRIVRRAFLSTTLVRYTNKCVRFFIFDAEVEYKIEGEVDSKQGREVGRASKDESTIRG